MVTSVLQESASSEIHVIHVTKQYQTGHKKTAVALDNASLWVRRGETVSVVGPTGCGKSTLLRVIAGLEWPESGALTFDGEDVASLSPSQRGIGLVFQNYALYPHFKVHGNIAFYFRLRRWKPEAIDSRVLETSRVMGIGFEKLLGRMPRSLSGGEKQRVALARCLSHNPRVLLLDEPFSNLDASLRLQTRSEVKKLVDRFSLTTVFVTHDQTEAVAMGHRLAVMRQGAIEQVGTYYELYFEPVNIFVAGFLGSPPMNFFAAQRQGEVIVFRVGETRLSVPLPPTYHLRLNDGDDLTIGLRPEHLRPGNMQEVPGLACLVDMVETSLSDAAQILHIEHGGEILRAKTGLHPLVQAREPLWLYFDPQHMYYFDRDGKRLV